MEDDDPRLSRALATIEAYALRAGVDRVVALLDAGDEHRIVIEYAPGEPFSVQHDDEAEPMQVASDPRQAPAELPDLRAIPGSALHPDLATGRISAPIGAVSHMADGLLALARALGGRSVATADFPTHDPELPVTLAARDGEPVVLDIGGNQFLLPE